MSTSAPTTRPAAVAAYTIKKTYSGKTVLAGVDLTIAEGEVLALLGPNGAGKTTTVRILSTLIPADGGTATVLGHDLRREAAAIRAGIGVTGQFSAVDDLLTGRENLLLMGRLLHLPAAERTARATALLDQFGLTEAAGRRQAGLARRSRVPGHLPGVRRRIRLARGRPAAARARRAGAPLAGRPGRRGHRAGPGPGGDRAHPELGHVVAGLGAAGRTRPGAAGR
jgi:ABC-type lipopolysaccharide export system ATPase subunit